MIISTFEFSSDLDDIYLQKLEDLFNRKFPMSDIESYETRAGTHVIEVRGERITPAGVSWIFKTVGVFDIISLTVNCKV